MFSSQHSGITVSSYFSLEAREVMALTVLIASYSAFCRQDGKHTTRAVGFRDWNAEVIASMIEDLDGPWGDLMAIRQQLEGELLAAVEDTIESSIRRLGEYGFSCCHDIVQECV